MTAASVRRPRRTIQHGGHYTDPVDRWWVGDGRYAPTEPLPLPPPTRVLSFLDRVELPLCALVAMGTFPVRRGRPHARHAARRRWWRRGKRAR